MKIFIFLYRIQKESRSACSEVRQGQVVLPVALCISENSQVSYMAGLQGMKVKQLRQHYREPLFFSLSLPSNGSDPTTSEINESFHSLNLAGADAQYFRKQRGSVSFVD